MTESKQKRERQRERTRVKFTKSTSTLIQLFYLIHHSLRDATTVIGASHNDIIDIKKATKTIKSIQMIKCVLYTVPKGPVLLFYCNMLKLHAAFNSLLLENQYWSQQLMKLQERRQTALIAHLAKS